MFNKKIASLTLVFICLFSNVVMGETTTLDLSINKIISKGGDFYFQIPVSWESYVSANRINDPDSSCFDEINFYYEPTDSGNASSFLMTLYIYKADQYVENPDETLVIKTGGYVFTEITAKFNPYSSTNDRIIFGRFLVELANTNFIATKVVTTTPAVIIQANTIVINNNLLTDIEGNPDFTVSINGELYLPLRAVGTKLGYTVTWIPAIVTATLVKGNKSVVVITNSNRITTPKIINDRTYLPLNFYMQYFDLSIEVDSKNNVKIKG